MVEKNESQEFYIKAQKRVIEVISFLGILVIIALLVTVMAKAETTIFQDMDFGGYGFSKSVLLTPGSGNYGNTVNLIIKANTPLYLDWYYGVSDGNSYYHPCGYSGCPIEMYKSSSGNIRKSNTSGEIVGSYQAQWWFTNSTSSYTFRVEFDALDSSSGVYLIPGIDYYLVNASGYQIGWRGGYWYQSVGTSWGDLQIHYHHDIISGEVMASSIYHYAGYHYPIVNANLTYNTNLSGIDAFNATLSRDFADFNLSVTNLENNYNDYARSMGTTNLHSSNQSLADRQIDIKYYESAILKETKTYYSYAYSSPTPTPTPTPIPEGKTDIGGKVYASYPSGDFPEGDINVYLYQCNYTCFGNGSFNGTLLDFTGSQWITGSYDFLDLSPQSWYMVFNKSGFQDFTSPLLYGIGGEQHYPYNYLKFDAKLKPISNPGTIYGYTYQVTELGSYDYLDDVNVSLYNSSGYLGSVITNYDRPSNTYPYFEFSELADGDYTLIATKTGGNYGGYQRNVSVASNSTRADLYLTNFNYNPETITVWGQVGYYDAQGNPIGVQPDAVYIFQNGVLLNSSIIAPNTIQGIAYYFFNVPNMGNIQSKASKYGAQDAWSNIERNPISEGILRLDIMFAYNASMTPFPTASATATIPAGGIIPGLTPVPSGDEGISATTSLIAIFTSVAGIFWFLTIFGCVGIGATTKSGMAVIIFLGACSIIGYLAGWVPGYIFFTLVILEILGIAWQAGKLGGAGSGG